MSKKRTINREPAAENFRHAFSETLKEIEGHYCRFHSAVLEKYRCADASYSHHKDAERFLQTFDEDYFNQAKRLAKHLKIEIDSINNLKKLAREMP